jgi:hypothetical protein
MRSRVGVHYKPVRPGHLMRSCCLLLGRLLREEDGARCMLDTAGLGFRVGGSGLGVWGLGCLLMEDAAGVMLHGACSRGSSCSTAERRSCCLAPASLCTPGSTPPSNVLDLLLSMLYKRWPANMRTPGHQAQPTDHHTHHQGCPATISTTVKTLILRRIIRLNVLALNY